MLGRSSLVGSAVDNEKFKTVNDAKKAFVDHCKSIQINQDTVNKMLSNADKAGDDFSNDTNMWYGCNKVAERCNGFPCNLRSLQNAPVS